ncbi:WXG100 family type VII secretion target [Kineococcus indalonis]|uniref:WXG100 family type VII secretion target n=1 Tax=Kineococcus indalonis TaxID=2696566 RepID=UPI00141282D6|nr:WXG100 family type VII secretion target [Kineococcus indalonis]NAZ88344.1 WXG100 family type VII secretion target [Kineococcus indalonis]
MANLNVTCDTCDEMRTASTDLENGKREVADQPARLKALVDGLVSAGYVTDGSSIAFKDAYDEFGTGTVLDDLTGVSTYLSTAAQPLEDTDSQLAARLGR